MLYLRQYKKDDAKTITGWFENETVFRKWSSDRFDSYPLSDEEMNRKYIDCNGDCAEADNFYPMTACDENGIVGHFILRYVNGDRQTLRIGFVVVDNKKRGSGYGTEMIRLALRYAFRIYGASRVTIGVFNNNPQAHRCYISAGFHDVSEGRVWSFKGEEWRVIEMAISREEYLNKI